MILIPVSEISGSNFWYDHGVSLISAIVTFLAFVLTFGTLIYNSRKEKREAEDRSKKTLSVLDFIFESNNKELNNIIEQIEQIKKRRPEEARIPGHILGYALNTEEGKEELKEKEKELASSYFIDYRGMSIVIPGIDPIVKTEFQHSYIVLETYRYLEKNNFILELNKYEDAIKSNLKNQHLNITSGSLEKISDRIHAIKESKSILNSMRIDELLRISMLEGSGRTKDEINEKVKENVDDYIRKDYEKVLNLERELKKVITPLNSDDSF